MSNSETNTPSASSSFYTIGTMGAITLLVATTFLVGWHSINENLRENEQLRAQIHQVADSSFAGLTEVDRNYMTKIMVNCAYPDTKTSLRESGPSGDLVTTIRDQLEVCAQYAVDTAISVTDARLRWQLLGDSGYNVNPVSPP